MNILILDYKNHQYGGGIETYTNELLKILLEEGHNCYELSQLNEKLASKLKEVRPRINNKNYHIINHNIKEYFFSKKNIIAKNFLSLLTYFKLKKLLKKTIKKYKIDFVIDSSVSGFWTPKKLNKLNKVVYIQHFDLASYRKRSPFLAKVILEKLFFQGPVTPISKMQKINKIVLFTDYDRENFYPCIFNKVSVVEKTKKIYPITYSIFNSVDIEKNIEKTKNSTKKNQIIFIGQYVEWKNIDFLLELKRELEPYYNVICFFSKSDDIPKKIENSNQNIFIGKSHDEAMQELSQSLALILTSDSEGLPLVTLESFSLNVPVILRDTFLLSQWLVGHNNERGMLINKNLSPKEVSSEIKNKLQAIVNNSDTKKNILSFAINNFTFELFKSKWIKVLKNTS
ncbi:glycosyltransferase [[Mycoplasma] testudinis]|uniref:glycosyltransferase n=1 Tax=[Mycoplasma] testudinis TaxID=33924 RepID=UPI00047F2F50|nr:glycosyltransferase [[Mycoplasma] testudinis]